MKSAEEYLKNVTCLTLREELYSIGKQMQIDAIEETVKLCAENAETKWNGDYIEVPVNTVTINKQSILNCADILKKELE